MARGGRRAGNRGQAYGNRTDLHSPLPVAAPTGLPYGVRGEQIAAQRAVPMGPAGSTAPGIPAGPPPQGPLPGSPGMALMRPTERPAEPVTAGIPLGAGPGPEVLSNIGTAGQSAALLLANLAQQPGATSDVKELANYAAQRSR